jgi:hypothetical protein
MTSPTPNSEVCTCGHSKTYHGATLTNTWCSRCVCPGYQPSLQSSTDLPETYPTMTPPSPKTPLETFEEATLAGLDLLEPLSVSPPDVAGVDDALAAIRQAAIAYKDAEVREMLDRLVAPIDDANPTEFQVASRVYDARYDVYWGHDAPNHKEQS